MADTATEAAINTPKENACRLNRKSTQHIN